ncbi:MAG TPA: cell division FtsA domain-containing protein [Planctomycetota bacterium]|nr:cell division FtsA domain-containing protein [Planctomycetota bacterium]
MRSEKHSLTKSRMRGLEEAGELIVAVDVGSARVACAVAETGGEHPVVIAAESAASFGIRGGEIVDMKRASEAIGIAIEAAADKADADVKTVVVGLSGDARLATVKAAMDLDREHRTVNAADVARLRKCVSPDPSTGRRVVHRFDGPYGVGDLQGVERPEGLLGDKLEMQATFLSASSDRLDNLLKAVRATGVEIEAVSLEPISCSLGVLTTDERALGAAVLDLGAGTFRGALWEGGRLRQIQFIGKETAPTLTQSGRSIAAVGGMEGVVMAVARRFRIAPATAERLMRTHAALGEDQVAALPDSVEVAAVDGLGSVRVETRELSRTVEELLTPVARSLREGLSGFSAGHSVGVVLTGGGAQIKGMDVWMSKRFGGATVRVGTPRWHLGEDVEIPAELAGSSGCSLCGLLNVGAQSRLELRTKRSASFFGRLSESMRRLAASF